MSVRFEFIGSGSKGNATLIQCGSTLIQVDMGVPLKRLKEGLGALGKTIEDIDAVLITHEHHDHVGTLNLLKKRGVKAYATRDTIPDDVDVEIRPGTGFSIGEIQVKAFSSSHDASDPLNFVFSFGEETMAYVTDTGTIKKENKKLLKDHTYYLFESNYDKEMLRLSGRPASLRARIRGNHGHLGNEQSAAYMCEFLGPHTKKIYLAHLSEDCNRPEIALSTYKEVFESKGIAFPMECVIPLKQWERVEGGDDED